MKLFQSISALISVASATCYDGTNGGCSHTCTSSGCTCPTCWTLGTDGKTCEFENGKATVTCSATGAEILIDKCALPGVDATTIHLKDGSCAATQDTDNTEIWKINTGFDNCGSEFGYASDVDKLTLSNTLSIGSSVIGERVVSRKYDIDFTCMYNNVAEATSSISASNDVFTGVTFDINQPQPTDIAFPFDLNFYESEAFTTIADLSTGAFTPGAALFGKITPTSALPSSLEYSVGKCKVEDTTIPASLDILDTCPVEGVNFSFKDSQTSQSAVNFSFESFVFPTSADDTTIDVTCEVNVCTVGAADCLKQCCTMSSDAIRVTLTVITAGTDVSGAKTDTSVWFRFVKSGCTYEWIELNLPIDDREYGAIDVHEFAMATTSDECLLDIPQIEFREDDDDGWYPTEVKLEVNIIGSCTNEVTQFDVR